MSAPRSGILPAADLLHDLAHLAELLDELVDGWTFVPDPCAIRSRREPLMSSGRRRSSGVIDRMIASMRSSSRSSTFMPFSCWPAKPGIIPSSDRQRAHPADHLELGEEVLERELVAAQLALELLGLVLVELLLGLLDEATGRRPSRGSAAPCGRGGSARTASSFSPVGGEQDRLAGDRLDRQRGAAARVAVELGHHARRRTATASANCSATLTASWPVIASTTSRIACGLTALRMFFELVHELLVDVQAAGGVDDQDVLAVAAWPGPAPSAAMSTGSLVGALLVDVGADLAADLHELVDRGRAVDVAGGDARPTSRARVFR